MVEYCSSVPKLQSRSCQWSIEATPYITNSRVLGAFQRPAVLMTSLSSRIATATYIFQSLCERPCLPRQRLRFGAAARGDQHSILTGANELTSHCITLDHVSWVC